MWACRAARGGLGEPGHSWPSPQHSGAAPLLLPNVGPAGPDHSPYAATQGCVPPPALVGNRPGIGAAPAPHRSASGRFRREIPYPPVALIDWLPHGPARAARQATPPACPFAGTGRGRGRAPADPGGAAPVPALDRAGRSWRPVRRVLRSGSDALLESRRLAAPGRGRDLSGIDPPRLR